MAELPKHTNSLQIKVDNKVKPYKKVDAIIIPEGATNGDVIKALFPEIEMWGKSEKTLDYSLGGMIHRVTKSWWNAPYRKVEE